jgi:hypothetical protein
MSHTKHSEHTERGEPNCIACLRENEAELATREGRESIEAPFVAYSAYHTRYAYDFDNLASAMDDVSERKYGAVYVRVDYVEGLKWQMRVLGLPNLAAQLQAAEALAAAAALSADFSELDGNAFRAKYPEYVYERERVGLAWDAERYIRNRTREALASWGKAKGEE